MGILILGLLLFLGVHSARIFAEGARQRFIAQRGASTWKGLYTLVSITGFALIIWGYGLARQSPLVLWPSPVWTRHLASLFTLASFILMAAVYVPRNGLKARLHHPMVLAVKVWALGHLLANNTLADLLLFGGFLVWSVFSFRAARQRDRAGSVAYAAGTMAGTLMTVVIGTLVWLVFAMWAHRVLIGVSPFGG